MPKSLPITPRFFTHFERILNFSDGIFAFAITLMVFSLSVPILTGSTTGPDLPSNLIAEWPTFLGYFISFFVIGSWWTVHHRNFQYLIGYNRQLLWLNLLFLLCITLIPFLTNLIIIYHGSVFAISLYASVQATAGIIMLIIWRYATQKHRFVDRSINPTLVTYISVRNAITILSFLFSIPIALISIATAQFLWVIHPFLIGFVARRLAGVKQFNDTDNEQ